LVRSAANSESSVNRANTVEIAVVVVKAEGAKPKVIWPEELRGKDFDEAIKSFWPQK
jgi:hypothetical protein